MFAPLNRMMEASRRIAEGDLTPIRPGKRYRDEFETRHGVRLGFMSFFVKASIDALQTVPQVNAQIQGAVDGAADGCGA